MIGFYESDSDKETGFIDNLNNISAILGASSAENNSIAKNFSQFNQEQKEYPNQNQWDRVNSRALEQQTKIGSSFDKIDFMLNNLIDPNRVNTSKS
jgi:hypothetical protein